MNVRVAREFYTQFSWNFGALSYESAFHILEDLQPEMWAEAYLPQETEWKIRSAAAAENVDCRPIFKQETKAGKADIMLLAMTDGRRTNVQ